MTKKQLALVIGAVVVSAVIGAVSTSFAGKHMPGPSTQPKPLGLLRLDKNAMYPPSVIPKVRSAQEADKLGGKRAGKYRDSCSPQTVQIGTICMMSNPYPLDPGDLGKNDYFFATQTCAKLGGFLPTAAQLIGAAPFVKLAGRVDDNEVTASTDIDPTDGLKDRREMTSDLTTTASGGRAAGSEGVSDEARGNPNTGEPDPTPFPANPSPETLQYITVYDNGNKGGFAGGQPVGQPENFRCAFNFAQGDFGDLG